MRHSPARLILISLTAAIFGGVCAQLQLAAGPPTLHAAVAGAPAIAAPANLPLAASPAQADTLSTYQLFDTWKNRPWTLTAGRYGEATDISSAPDNTIYILDGYHAAIHVLAPDGTPQRVFRVADLSRDMTVQRLDVGFDGQLYVLAVSCANCPARSQVDELAPDGRRVNRMVIDERYSDVAQRSNGNIYLVRPDDSDRLGRRGVDVYQMNGTWLDTLSPEELDTPSRVDVAADGTIYVLHEVPIPVPPPDPRPRVPPPPSLLVPPAASTGSPAAEARPLGIDILPKADRPSRSASAPLAAPVTGVIIFNQDHTYRETVPFEFGLDVAVGDAGVFVSRYGEVYALREDDPLTPPVGQRWTGRISLDVTADGRVLGSLNHCYFQGMLIYSQPKARPAYPRLLGSLDRPILEGPVYPLRVATGRVAAAGAGAGAGGVIEDDVALLQGRYMVQGQRPNQTNWTQPVEPQSVQRWNGQGTLRYQLGMCGRTTEASWVRDVALDGQTAYTIDSTCIEKRPDDQFPAWQICPQGLFGASLATHLAAISADAGRVAVLDAGAAAVLIFDQQGAVLHKWQLGGAAGQTAVSPAVDIALAGDRVYLADQGRSVVQVRGLDGALIAEWAVPDSPERLAVGPAGPAGGASGATAPAQADVFVLGRGGWGFRYDSDGTLLAAWQVADPLTQVRDIGVLSDGRVLVSYVKFEKQTVSTQNQPPGRPPMFPGPVAAPPAKILDAGIWVYAPSTAPPPGLPGVAGKCSVAQDKRAQPARVNRGQTVDLALTVKGVCPGRLEPLQLAIVFDTSRSMDWGYALSSAQHAVLETLGVLDPRVTEVALITFADTPALLEPLTRDLIAVSRHVAALTADGDTQLAGAVDLARRQLDGPARDPAARHVILLVTDANPKDDTGQALADAAADGLELNALVYQTGQRADAAFVNLFSGTGGQFMFDPQAYEVAHFATSLRREKPEPGLFRTIDIVDEVPANMRYVVDSAIPPAAAAARPGGGTVLTWTLKDVAADQGVKLAYRLEPLECGTWPTNIQASADYRDAWGQAGHLTFPVPQVEVVGCDRRASRVYLPILSKEQCFRNDRPLDVVLVMDTSQSMSEPAGEGASPTATKLDAARAAAREFLAELRLPLDRAGVVAFNVTAHRASALTGDRPALQAALDALATSPGTRIDLGLAEARAVLAAGARVEARPVVILLSDGRQNGLEQPVLDEAAALRSGGTLVYAIGLGTDADRPLLTGVASSEDRVYLSPSGSDLARIYAQISERLACDVR